MKAKIWLAVNAGYFGLLGAAIVVAPVPVLRLFYVPQVGGIAPYEARLAGSLGVALFAVILAIRGSRDPTVLRTTLAALLFVDLVNLAQTVAGALSGVGEPTVLWWLVTVVIFAFAAGTTYFLLQTRSASAGS
jgi:hypothetical protein